MNTAPLAFLDGLGGPELFVIGIVVLLLFGSKRMPEIGRGLGRAIREFKRATSSVEENIREVIYDEPARPRLRPPAQRRSFREPESAAGATPATGTPQPTPLTSAPAQHEIVLDGPDPHVRTSQSSNDAGRGDDHGDSESGRRPDGEA